MTWTAAELVGLLVLVSAHLIGGRLPRILGDRHRGCLSLFGGIAVAYVFVHLLPELGAAQLQFEDHVAGFFATFESHVYLIALVGLVVFYGAESGIRRHRSTRPGDAPSEGGAFWVHVATFAVYNGLVGYLLVRGEERSATEVGLYTAAMFLHFLVVDFGLAKDHRAAYGTEVRWLLALAIAAGCGLGIAVEMSHLAIEALTAFLAGGVLLNVLKEELPEEEESYFVPFVAGAGGYAGLLLMI